MASITYLTSTALMGVLLVAVVVWMLGARDWYHYVPTAAGVAPGREDAFTVASRTVRSPVTWTVSFLVFAFAAVLGGLAFVGSDVVSVADTGTVGLAMAAVAGVLLAVYLFAGSYYLAKSRGVGDAAATAAGAAVVGLALSLAVFVKLFAGL